MDVIFGSDWTSRLSVAAVCVSLALISAIVIGFI
jgi:hypothetical protein